MKTCIQKSGFKTEILKKNNYMFLSGIVICRKKKVFKFFRMSHNTLILKYTRNIKKSNIFIKLLLISNKYAFFYGNNTSDFSTENICFIKKI